MENIDYSIAYLESIFDEEMLFQFNERVNKMFFISEIYNTSYFFNEEILTIFDVENYEP